MSIEERIQLDDQTAQTIDKNILYSTPSAIMGEVLSRVNKIGALLPNFWCPSWPVRLQLPDCPLSNPVTSSPGYAIVLAQSNRIGSNPSLIPSRPQSCAFAWLPLCVVIAVIVLCCAVPFLAYVGLVTSTAGKKGHSADIGRSYCVLPTFLLPTSLDLASKTSHTVRAAYAAIQFISSLCQALFLFSLHRVALFSKPPLFLSPSRPVPVVLILLRVIHLGPVSRRSLFPRDRRLFRSSAWWLTTPASALPRFPSALEPFGSVGNIENTSRFSEITIDDKPTGRYTPDILAGVYRGIRKLPSVKLSRSPSRLNLKSSSNSLHSAHSSTSSVPPNIETQNPQHVRNLTLQYSLAKPLPKSPPCRDSISPHDSNSPNLPSVPEGEITDLCFPDPSPSTSPLPTPPPKPEGYSYLDSRPSTMESASAAQSQHPYGGHETNNSMSSVSSARYDSQDPNNDLKPRSTSTSAGPSPNVAQRPAQPVGGPSSSGPSTHLSGLMCNVHRTTGREPHALVGATTTILGDKLYVFGGRILSRSRPAPLTSDMYELDLIRRHWTKLETTGDIPPPRYFHSMCALGDTKMVCYGGMSPAPNQPPGADAQQPEITVMSDIYIYDVNTKAWTFIPTQDPPQGRYAHCACILPSAASFSSHRAPLSALQHNPSTGNNEGRIGINIDGSGGAEMVIVGGQDGRNNYIEQISVFNLRSLKWTSTQPLNKSWGAYRSVTAPLPPSVASKLGRQQQSNGMHRPDGGISQEAREPGASMLIYCNYNFLDVKLELQIRSPDGTLTERPMSGNYSPPGLRFPNGGVIDTHFVVSGTYLTSSRQEYALWALDLRTLTWSRIDAGGSVFSQGSWNRGVLWNRRNTFVILGNRKRSLVDDYNHRRINFSNVCMVELEAFGFYDNPRKTSPLSGFISASSPYAGPGLSLARKAGCTAGGRYHSRASEELGEKAFAIRELADMDILCIGGERIPVNSRIVGRRWGPYFVQLLREGTATQDGSDAVTLRSGLSSNPLRASAITITPNTRGADSSSMMSTMGSSLGSSGIPPSTAASSISTGAMGHEANPSNINAAPTPHSLPPNSRPRCLYLPHTYLTIQALLHFLYTSSLPPPTSPLCTPQILCSLLQIARPYRIDGLLEAVVERLHSLLDSRNAAAVFNATAMAAGGGRGIDGSLNPNFFVGTLDPVGSPTATSDFSLGQTGGDGYSDLATRTEGLSLNTNVQQFNRPSSDELSATTSQSGSEWSSSEIGGSERDNYVWNGELSSVIGLQKRGLRGLMEGRRMRERTGTAPGGNGTSQSYQGGQGQGQQRVGLGIAGS